MATSAQVKFFEQLTDDRDFSGHNVTELRQMFGQLSQNAASSWIEKALTLPKKDAGQGDNTAPPF